VFESDSELDGFYRFANNKAVDYQELIRAHVDSTCQRLVDEPTVVVSHDTTGFRFPGQSVREGVGWIRRNEPGFQGHFALAVSAGPKRQPFGVLGMIPVIRSQPPKPKKAKRRLAGWDFAKRKTKETDRWLQLVKQVEHRVARSGKLLHVMDREADCFALLFGMKQAQYRFLVRARHNRVVDGLEGVALKLRQLIATSPVLLEKEVPLSPRKKSSIPGAMPARNARRARLQVGVARASFRPPPYAKHRIGLELNVLYVREIDPPQGEEPVEWILLTTERVQTPTEVEAVLEAYCRRWMIEEYFKALKSGCSYEQRQHESLSALLISLALLIPVAWKLLELRHFARNLEQEPATAVFDETQVPILRLMLHQRGKTLSPTPSCREVMLAVAALGGHLKRNGEPGWIVLRRGLEKFLAFEAGWRAAIALSESSTPANRRSGG
jgi:hypothetical protein